MNVLVFEDHAVTELFPATTGRPAFQISCASFCLQDWFPKWGNVKTLVRPHLRAIQRLEYPERTPKLDESEPLTLAINARLVPGKSVIENVARFIGHADPGVWQCENGSVAFAILPTDTLVNSNEDNLLSSLIGQCRGLEKQQCDENEIRLYHYPHDLIRENINCFRENLDCRIANGQYQEIADGVFVGHDVKISDYVVTNTANGPIVIESGSAIGPFCFLRGPIYIGQNCRVNEHSAIKDHVTVSHTTKIGGEVEESVIEAFSNKQHHGFLGHSYLGSWINLGAGTCNSDLKNTYGEVNMIYNGKKVGTGMQFVGCVMGDYAKSAINTSIFTGKLIGAGSMIYGFVTTNVPSFVNYARSFGQITESPPGILELTQKRMLMRRNVQQRPEDIQLIRDMYELTRHERQISEEPLSL